MRCQLKKFSGLPLGDEFRQLESLYTKRILKENLFSHFIKGAKLLEVRTAIFFWMVHKYCLSSIPLCQKNRIICYKSEVLAFVASMVATALQIASPFYRYPMPTPTNKPLSHPNTLKFSNYPSLFLTTFLLKSMKLFTQNR